MKNNKVANLHVAYDVGRVVNPQSCTGQAEGGAIMGMGYAVTEDFPYKEGYVTSKYGTLGLLRATQCPSNSCKSYRKGTPEQYAYGAEGIGEISSIPVPAIHHVDQILLNGDHRGFVNRYRNDNVLW